MEVLQVNFRGRDKVKFTDGEEIKEVIDFFIQEK